MDDEALLPRRVTLLGEAMRPVWQKIEAQLDSDVIPTRPVDEISETVVRHLNELQALIQHIIERGDNLSAEVVENEGATDGDVYRAVGRFEAFVDDFLAGYHDVRTLDTYGSDADACGMLADVYRHLLVEIRDWLEDLVETLADPIAALRRRGLPTTGFVELPLTLTLTAPSERLATLSRWVTRNMGDFSEAETTGRKSGLGFWGAVGAAILGWGIGEALFGDNDCGTGDT